MKRVIGLVVALGLVSSAWAQLPVGRVIPTDNFAISHISGTLHVAGSVSLSGGHSLVFSHVSSVSHVVLVASGHANVIRAHVGSAFRAWRVANCGTAAALVVANNPDRRDLYLQNLGGASASGTHNNLYLGYGTQGHVALTINNGWVLHSMGFIAGGSQPFSGGTAQIILPNYQGPVACIGEAANTQLGILEILR